MDDQMIVGWAVYRDNIENAALYNLKQEAEAMSAAIRWGAKVNALVLHPGSPSPVSASEQVSISNRGDEK